MAETTYVLGDDGMAYLYRNGEVLASSQNIDELEHLAQDSTFGQQNLTPSFPPSPTQTQTNQPCLNCGGKGCPNCTGPTGGMMASHQMPPIVPPAGVTAGDRKEERETLDEERVKTDDVVQEDPFEKLKKSTHFVSPNGVKGRIVGYTKGLWGNEVTVRLENGRIAKYDLVDDTYTLENNDQPRLSKYKVLQSKLDEIPAVTLPSLRNRLVELAEIKKQARALVADAPYLDAQELDNMIVTADYEINEVKQAISALEHEPKYSAPEYHAVEQGSMGGSDASWLNDILEDALGESYANDFDTMMEEAPESLVAGLDGPMIPDADAVANVANDFVTSHTVGLDPDKVSLFRQAFLKRVEEVRIKEASTRVQKEQKTAKKMAKTAKQARKEAEAHPDEGLFL